MSNKQYDYLLKILLIGDEDVGKTAILFRFCDDAFNASFISTIGIDFKIKTVEVNGKVVKLQIWDTAGQERFKTITYSYLRGAHGVMLVYSVTSRQSFESITAWKENLEKIEVANIEDIEMILVGNNCENTEERMVDHESGRAFADEIGLNFFEISAKTNINIEISFMTLVTQILNKLQKKEAKQTSAETKEKKSESCLIAYNVAQIFI